MNFFAAFVDELGQLNKQAQVDEDKVVTFLLDHPNPSDPEFHEWAEKQSVDPSQAEVIAYRLAAKYARFAKGGLSQGSPPEGMDPEELKRGIQVEMEHTPDADVAKKVALDHLTENADYYTHLDKMETKMSNVKKKAAKAEMEGEQGGGIPGPEGTEQPETPAGPKRDRDNGGANFGGRPPELGQA